MASGKIEEAAGANTVKFLHFDFARDYSDHLYIDLNGSPEDKKSFTDENGPLYDKILEEWATLYKFLPNHPIYVRTYRERVDLIRAMFIGPSGTPYHDGLFFFDIAFPPDFPNSPPKVSYHSHGLNLNPNLHEYIEELWKPSSSTILELLTSIQDLMLDDNPYSDEHGNESIEWAHYNEDVFICSCRSMAYTISKPPKNFEDFVMEHFRQRACAILGAMKVYKDEIVTIGYYEHGGSSLSTTVRVSEEFKVEVENLRLELEKGLSEMEKNVTAAEIGLSEMNVAIEEEKATEPETYEAGDSETDETRDSEINETEEAETDEMGKAGEKEKLFPACLKPKAKIEKRKRGILKRVFSMVKFAFGMKKKDED